MFFPLELRPEENFMCFNFSIPLNQMDEHCKKFLFLFFFCPLFLWIKEAPKITVFFSVHNQISGQTCIQFKMA